MRIVLVGFGNMGKVVAKVALEQKLTLAGIVDKSMTASPLPGVPLFPTLFDEVLKKCDVVIEFAHAQGIIDRIREVSKYKVPYVIGTTDWENKHEEAKKIVQKAKSALLVSPNFSLGVNLLYKLCDCAGALFSPFKEYAPSLLEIHHSTKKDAPSGTAKKIAERMQTQTHKKIPITSIREGFFPGTHELTFDSIADTITISHTARTREGFAQGALEAARWIQKKKGWFTFDDVIW